MNGDFLQIVLRGYNMMTRGPVLIKTGTSFIEESLHARTANSSYPVAEEIIIPLLKRNTTFGFSLAFYIFFHKIRCFLYKNNTKISSGKEIWKDPEKYNHVPRGKKYQFCDIGKNHLLGFKNKYRKRKVEDEKHQ